MKIVTAIDSFKGSMTSIEAGKAVAEGFERVCPGIGVDVRPLADGGEGTVEALVEGMNGQLESVEVTGPFGKKVSCAYGIIKESMTAVIEMSGAGPTGATGSFSGSHASTATTYGVGEVIRDAIEKGCRRFIVGIGGSATNDGGIGMLEALGFGFLDSNGKQIERGAKGIKELDKITDDYVLPELKECKFMVACDVTNPLCGTEGCSAVYGPQKGATPSMIMDMDKWLGYYAAAAKEKYPHADAKYPGTGGS